MGDRDWKDEWEQLRLERVAARRRWRSASAALSVRARDPVGLKDVVRRHPYLVTSVAAGVGGLLISVLVGRRRRRRAAPERARHDGARHDGARQDDDREPQDAREERAPSEPSVVGTVLRNTLVSVATPLLTRYITDRLEQYLDLDGREKRAREPAHQGNGPNPDVA